MEESTIIVGVPAGKLEDMIAGAVLSGLRVFHNGREQTTAAQPEELLTREGAAELLGITLPTLREYTNRGLVTGYRIGTRVRYKRTEVLNGLQQIRTAKNSKGR
jgi:excisionase family DNA binding protein